MLEIGGGRRGGDSRTHGLVRVGKEEDRQEDNKHTVWVVSVSSQHFLTQQLRYISKAGFPEI